MSKTLCVVIPSYNEEENILTTAKTVLAILDSAAIDCRLLFVSDGSKDRTFEKIREAAQMDPRVRGIEFSRNFGKEAAILAGLGAQEADCYCVMDCDLQHPPQTIVQMYRKWEEGYLVVEGIKNAHKRHNALHQGCARLFYGLLSRFTGFDLQNTSDFKLIDKQVAQVLTSMTERKTFFRALTFWTGFQSCSVSYDVAPRLAGETKWNARSLIRYALQNIISFSSVPLNIVTFFGSAALIVSVILGLQTLIRWLMGNSVEGFTTVILLLLLLGGCTLMGLGIIGQYIAAIYNEIKQRPRFIIGKDTKE